MATKQELQNMLEHMKSKYNKWNEENTKQILKVKKEIRIKEMAMILMLQSFSSQGLLSWPEEAYIKYWEKEASKKLNKIEEK